MYVDEGLRVRLETASDEAECRLIDAAVGGDAQAFVSLYDRHLDRVYGYVYRRLGNQADAEDLTQQVFLQAWQAMGRYKRGGTPFIAWLVKIAHNSVVSFYRRTKVTSYLDIEPKSREDWADPEAEVLAEDDRLAVRRAILRLKPEQQQVIVMRFVEQFEYAEIAAVMGKSEGNIRVIQHRAIAELRRLLNTQVDR